MEPTKKPGPGLKVNRIWLCESRYSLERPGVGMPCRQSQPAGQSQAAEKQQGEEHLLRLVMVSRFESCWQPEDKHARVEDFTDSKADSLQHD